MKDLINENSEYSEENLKENKKSIEKVQAVIEKCINEAQLINDDVINLKKLKAKNDILIKVAELFKDKKKLP